VRNLRENEQHGLAPGETPREIQPNNQKKTKTQFAVGSNSVWRKSKSVHQVH